MLRKIAITLLAVFGLSLLAAVVGSSGIAGGRWHELETGSAANWEDISSKIIRLHVVANGNSPEEQELKLQVRDAVLKAMGKDLANFDSLDETREYIKAHLEDIENIAREVVEKNGKSYSVKALFGKFPFPVKTYGFITLPAGEYEALRIVIGEGKGKNWWCILFPPLCFVDITHGVAAGGEKWEVKGAADGGDERTPVVVKFKTVELIHTAWEKLQQNFKVALNK